MEAHSEKVAVFLKKYKMDLQEFDFEDNCNEFILEMENGLAGKGSSLNMIPTYINMGGDVPQGKPVIVVDAGGTNVRVAVIQFTEDHDPLIEDYKVYPMPGIDQEISKEEFFKTFALYLQPVLDKSDKIGFCFSYAIEHLNNKDGKIIRLGKQIQAKDAVGATIGSSLLQAFSDLGLPSNKKIVVLNDTIAAQLSAGNLYQTRKFDDYIGFILGTGTNTCYSEENNRITKIASLDPNGSMLINIESGGYHRFHQGIIDKEYDRSLADTGQYTYEKMVSGKYQGGLLLAVIKSAVEDELFSTFFSEKIRLVKKIQANEIDDFLYFPYSRNRLAECCSLEDDRIILYYLIDAIQDRAARLVAVNLASIIKKTGKGTNPCKPVCIAAEGSTFKKSKLFKGKLNFYIKQYLNDRMGLNCEIVESENSTLIGTAIAGLSN